MSTAIVSPVPTADDLADMGTQVRQLWMAEPRVNPDLRRELLGELLDIELVLQRLTMRDRWSSLDDEDLDEFHGCSRRLAALRDRWSHEPRRTD